MPGAGAFWARITPDRGWRRAMASADHAGELLSGLGYLGSMQGSRLSVQADYAQQLDMQDTIVPADFFNSLLVGNCSARNAVAELSLRAHAPRPDR